MSALPNYYNETAAPLLQPAPLYLVHKSDPSLHLAQPARPLKRDQASQFSGVFVSSSAELATISSPFVRYSWLVLDFTRGINFPPQ